MTVSYMREIATVGPFTYMKVLWRWRGSIWKGLITEFFCWFFLYNSIALFYRIFLFGSHFGAIFESSVNIINDYLKTYGSTLNFVAAFYITYINTRWWWLFTQIPWPDNLCMLISALMRSNGKNAKAKERQIRLAICRYWNLSFILLLRDISVPAKKRFPTLEDLSRLATSEEISLLRQADDMLGSGFQQTCLYSLPLDWIQKIIKQAADEGNFLKAHITTLHEEIVITRQKMYNLLAQDFLCALPISLTQVAIATPVTYFLMCLIGKQYVVFNKGFYAKEINEYAALFPIPIYTIYEFIIYIGWMKAAIAMLNPFGMDDDDFEVDFLIDRNNNYTRVVLDDLFEVVPTPADVEFKNIPHTFESAKNAHNVHPMVGSVANVPMDKLVESKTNTKPSSISPLHQKVADKLTAGLPLFAVKASSTKQTVQNTLSTTSTVLQPLIQNETPLITLSSNSSLPATQQQVPAKSLSDTPSLISSEQSKKPKPKPQVKVFLSDSQNSVDLVTANNSSSTPKKK